MLRIENFDKFKRKLSYIFQNTLLVLGLIYLLLIPLGKIGKDQKIGSQEIQIMLILLVTSSGLMSRLDNLKLGKDGIEACFEKVKEEIQNIQSSSENQENQNVLAIEYVDLFLSETITIKKISEHDLESQILKASPLALEFIYQKAKEARKSASANSKKGLIERTIPIFAALTKSQHRKEKHRFFAQLGYALKDQSQPDWQAAKDNLEQAIQLWKEEHQASSLPPHYCFNWVICAIKLENKAHPNTKSEVASKMNIIDRMKCVNQCEVLTKSLYEDESVNEWLKYNNQISISEIQQYKPNENCYSSNTNEDD
jgi:hypothetical protein